MLVEALLRVSHDPVEADPACPLAGAWKQPQVHAAPLIDVQYGVATFPHHPLSRMEAVRYLTKARAVLRGQKHQWSLPYLTTFLL